MLMRYLYVMLSRTDTRMGRFIRFFTQGQYNHVSLCIDDDLKQFVSFARYRQDVPLAGGCVAEFPERLLSCGSKLPVKIFRLEITQSEASHLEALFERIERAPLVYNSLGALLSSCHIPCAVPGAYTCLEFAGTVLGKTYPSIQALEAALEPYVFYQGDLFDLLEDTGDRTAIYFQRRGLWKGSWDTAVHFKTLLWRILRLEKPLDPIALSNLKITAGAKRC
jgi:hypothetical protein